MLIPFKCTIGAINILRLEVAKLKGWPLYRKAPYNKNRESEKFYKEILNKCTNGRIIDGSNLKMFNFPFNKSSYNIFISYSHDDENSAEFLYQWFTSHHLTCFMDSTIWHSADKLLKVIDEEYCLLDDGRPGFDYRKRNFSTSHVHAMLSMAMLEAINRSECCIFIKSSQSVPLKKGIEDKTLSPWIYEENLFMDRIRRRIPERYCKPESRYYSDGGMVIVENAAQNLKISYNLECEFKRIRTKDMLSLRGGEAALDKLYEQYGALTQQDY